MMHGQNGRRKQGSHGGGDGQMDSSLEWLRGGRKGSFSFRLLWVPQHQYEHQQHRLKGMKYIKNKQAKDTMTYGYIWEVDVFLSPDG